MANTVTAKSTLIPFKDQLPKLINYLKLRGKRFQYEHILDGYDIVDIKHLDEYACMCLLLILTAENINEKIKITAQMQDTATLYKQEKEFKAFYTKIKRKKSFFSSKIRNKRKTIRNNEPLSSVSKYQRDLKGTKYE